jgi:hypothetical protein
VKWELELAMDRRIKLMLTEEWMWLVELVCYWNEGWSLCGLWSLRNLGWSTWGVQVSVFRPGCCVNSWFPFIDGVSLPTTSR